MVVDLPNVAEREEGWILLVGFAQCGRGGRRIFMDLLTMAEGKKHFCSSALHPHPTPRSVVVWWKWIMRCECVYTSIKDFNDSIH